MLFSNQTLQTIISILKDELSRSHSVTFRVLNPDIGDFYSGTKIELDGTTYIYRGYKNWVDLAHFLGSKMATPKLISSDIVEICYRRLSTDSFHNTRVEDIKEKYGVGSTFSLIDKSQESSFLFFYLQALKDANIENRGSILNLGVNRADEFVVIKEMLKDGFEDKQLVGIDHSTSAIKQAKERFEGCRGVEFFTHDINELDSLGLGRFDMLISIGTLQSTTINFKPFFMSLVQNYLSSDSAVVLGFPNSRWVGGELLYGAKVPNYSTSELGLLFSDVMFCKKYLQQKRYRVKIIGKDYIFLIATKIGVK